MAIIGIDLGTTNSLAVCYRNEKAEIIKTVWEITIFPLLSALTTMVRYLWAGWQRSGLYPTPVPQRQSSSG